MERWNTGRLGGDLALRTAIASAPQILDGDDVQRVERDDFTIAVHHGKRARSDQAVSGAQRKWVETASGNALANSFQIHARSLSPPRCPVKRGRSLKRHQLSVISHRSSAISERCLVLSVRPPLLAESRTRNTDHCSLITDDSISDHGQVLKQIWYFYLAVREAQGACFWFLVMWFYAQRRAKTSRGAGCVLSSTRPPAVESGRSPTERGGAGGRSGGQNYSQWRFVGTTSTGSGSSAGLDCAEPPSGDRSFVGCQRQWSL